MKKYNPNDVYTKASSQWLLALVWTLICVAILMMSATKVLANNHSMPMAGYQITNQAQAYYYHTRLGGVETVVSNITSVNVLPVQGILLENPQSQSVAPGSWATMSHRLTNTGNTDANIDFSHVNGSGDDFDLTGIALYIDTNHNGVIDDTDIQHLSGQEITLQAGESIDLLMTGQTPTNMLGGTYALAHLKAFIPGTSIESSVTDMAVIAEAAVMRFFKVANVTDRNPGDDITYQLSGTNLGNANMNPIAVTINGLSDLRVIVRDNIPLNTHFSTIVNAGTSDVLYHIAGTAEHEYQTNPPLNKGMIDAVVFAYDTVPVGYSFEVSFSVSINTNGGHDINNTATSYFNTLGNLVVVDSNQVVINQPPAPAVMDFMNSSFTNQQQIINAGDTINLQADAAACNQDASVIESYTVVLRGQLTGDLEEDFLVIETGPNTGTFTFEEIVTAAWPANPQITNNGIVEVTRNDFLTARWDSCPGIVLETRLLIDPAGIVFDSRNNQPVANARVILQGVNPDGSLYVPTVFNSDLQPVSNEFVTDSDGFYEFPLVPEGEYRLLVIPPSGFSFTSIFMREDLSPERRIDEAGSYYGTFPVNGATGPVFFDIPLDPIGLTGLFAEKTASRNVAAVGESILYTVKITNSTLYDMFDVEIDDFLPAGFLYIKGTSKRNGVAIDDPKITEGSHLQYLESWFIRDTSITFTYRVQVRVSALRGTGINRARARNVNAESNVAIAEVKVEDDVFSDEAFVIGKIFMDCNRDGIQTSEELGIPGVRLYLQDGSFVVSDVEGKYSFAGIQAKTQVLKVDKTTLPPQSEMTILSNRNAGDPYSQFVDAKRGELFRADFAVSSCTDAVLESVKQRRAKGAVRVAEVDQQLQRQLKTEPETGVQDRRSLPSSGIIGEDGRVSGYKSLNAKKNLPSKSLVPQKNPVRGDSVNMEELIKEMDPELDFIDLKDGDTLASSQLSIRVKGVAGGTLQLSVNGKVENENRIGQKVAMASTGVQAWEYIAVRLEPGENTLLLEQLDQFKNSRGSKSITVSAPGALGQLKVNTESDGYPADGHTPVEVYVELKDDKGVVVTARTGVTLESTLGVWDMEDLDPREPGTQAFVEGGKAVFSLLPPDIPGETLIRVSSGVMASTIELDFLPDLRPLIVNGIVEGIMGVGTMDEDKVTPASANDGFEETIGGFNFSSDKKLQTGARGALFLKGKIRGDHLLTLSYDSDRDDGERLFRDIRPDEFYPVYGDSSVKGFDAQSTSKLFVRVDKGRSFVQYGDFSTNSDNEAQRLSNYNRSFNGVQAHYENEKVEINAFASHDYTSQVVREFRGKGISGPYPLNNQSMVRQSETVEILIRDREQPSLVLESRTLTRFVDYSLDFFSGDLIFRQPIASIDADLNPVFIRVTFEADSGQESFWVYGADGKMKVFDWLEVGLSNVTDDNPENNYNLNGANATLQLTESDKLVVEYAHSSDETEGDGFAARMEWKHQGDRFDARVYGVRSEESFLNPNASVSSGKDEAGAQVGYRINQKNRVESELRYTKDVLTGDKRQGGTVTVESILTDTLTAKVGLRHVETTTAASTDDGEEQTRTLTSGLARLGWQPSFLPEASLYTEYEQELSGDNSSRAQIGGEYQFSNRGRIYARHELISSISGEYGLDDAVSRNESTVIGLDLDYFKNGHMFTEYRVRDAISGNEAEAAIGSSNSWEILDGLSLSTSSERIMSLSDEGEGESQAMTAGLEYTGSERWKATGRVELRRSDTSESFLNTVGVAVKLDQSWSALLQNTLSIRENTETGDKLTEDRLRAGVAYRSTDTNDISGMARYEYKHSEDESNDDMRSAHIWSTHVNWHPSRAWTTSARYAGKYVQEDGLNYNSDMTAHLVSGRVTYDITERIDISAMAGVITNDGIGNHNYMAGIEVGYMLTTNLWVSAGYNIFEVKDKELPDSDYSNAGAYIRLRFKFDEDSFGWLK